MARGRDAADGAMITSFGAYDLKAFRVWTDKVPGTPSEAQMTALLTYRRDAEALTLVPSGCRRRYGDRRARWRVAVVTTRFALHSLPYSTMHGHRGRNWGYSPKARVAASHQARYVCDYSEGTAAHSRIVAWGTSSIIQRRQTQCGSDRLDRGLQHRGIGTGAFNQRTECRTLLG